jgi:hypothetical protein
MPRLTDNQIKQGILHDDIDVRFAALHYFSEGRSPDTSVMPVVIEALNRFGRDKAFRYVHPISRLGQTEATIQWAIEELRGPEVTLEFGASYHYHVAGLLAAADPRLTRTREDEILAIPSFDEHHGEELRRRLRLLGWDEAAMWRELEAVCEGSLEAEHIGQTRYHEGVDVVEAMARQGVRDIDRMMTILRAKYEEYEDNPMGLMEPLMVRLAGALRHEPAISKIVEKFREDYDILSEECQTALARIGGDAVLDAVRAVYLGEEWHVRLYATGALERIHSDAAVRVCADLLEKEPAPDLKDNLASGLAGQFSTEANEAAYRYLLVDGDSYDAMSAFVTSCALTGQDFPELKTWTDEVKGRRERKGGWKTLMPMGEGPQEDPDDDDPFPPPAPALKPIVAEKRAGRNDPCPCGSGKKFKKCCLNKEELL